MLEKKRFTMLTVALVSLAIALAGTAPILADDPPMLTPTPPHHSPTGGEERTSVDSVSGEPIEIVARRSAYAKHYQIGPGQFRAVIGAAPVHYLDERGRWQDINTDIVKLPDGTFVSAANSVKVHFPARLGPAGTIMADATAYPATAPSWQRAGVQGAHGEPVDIAASSRDFSIAWTPRAMAFSDEEGYTTLIADVAATDGDVHHNVIWYPEAFPHTTEEFKVLPSGFKHNLILSALPKPPEDSMSTLAYSGELTLPPEIVLFVDGVERKGDFTTGSAIKLRDQQGEIVGYLMAPYVYEQDDPRQMVQGTYAIHREAGRITLAVHTPLAWLTDPNRTYPVVIDPALYIGFWSDTFIAEGLPNEDFGSDSYMFIGYDPSPDWNWLAERALVIWDIGSLPEDATITEAYTELYLLDYYDASDCEIGTHRVTSHWLWDEVTWNQRYSGTNWSTPGGDYATTADATVSVGANVNNWINMGDITSLVRDWHDGTYTNYGVLYKKTTESGTRHERLFAQYSYEDGSYAPDLYVDYTFTGSITTLSAYAPQTHSAPSNEDYYDHEEPIQWYWRSIGIRPPGDADYDIELYSDGDFWDMLWGSWHGTGSVDFVVISGPADPDVCYPKVVWYSGSGNYQIEFAPWTEDLDHEDTYGPYTMSTSSVLRTWDFQGTAGTTYRFTVQPTSGNADLGIALFAPSSAGGYDYMGLGDAVASADSAGAGDAETMNYTVGSDVWYGLVVWNNGATSSTQFTITIERANLVYLPLVSKNYVPPSPFTNGDFEQGTTGWTFGGDLQQHTVSTNMPRNGSRSAILGGDTSVYDCNGGVPQDKSAWMYQTFTVPDTVSPTLSFYYLLYSYDKKPTQGPSVGKLRDSFDVYINNERIHRDEIDWTQTYGCASPVNDRGWRQVTHDLSDYKGQNITLRFETWNRLDTYFNTWVYVDDVTVQ
jgi:hypothetical protein